MLILVFASACTSQPLSGTTAPLQPEQEPLLGLDFRTSSIPIQNQAETIRLTPQEAQAMMHDDVIVLDART